MPPASVLITGANRGIGLEFVKQYAERENGPKYIFAGCRSPESAEDLKELQRKYESIKIIKVDLKDESTFASAAKIVDDTVGDAGLNLLINNAGAGFHTDIDAITADIMIELYRVNAVGPLMLIKALIPLLRKAATGSDVTTMSSDRACVMNISTGVASITNNDTGKGYAYRSSKAALNMITKSLSIDLKKDGILVAAICPGWTKTGMGGPNATTDVDDSVRSVTSVIESLTSEDKSGKFYHKTGRELPF